MLNECQTDMVELPAYMTKRKLYETYCYQGGYCVKPQARGKYGRVSLYQIREDVDREEVYPVCSWTYFWLFWKKHYSNIKICPPSDDICGDCVIFKNRFKFNELKC